MFQFVICFRGTRSCGEYSGIGSEIKKEPLPKGRGSFLHILNNYALD